MAEPPDPGRTPADSPDRGDVTRALDDMFVLGSGDAWIRNIREAVAGPRTAEGRLGAYEGFVEIGRGGQGTVYRARQPVTGRVVAIKRVGTLAGERAIARFEREVEALTRLSHANVVTVHGAEVVEGHAVIVMEFVDGESIDVWASGVRRELPAAEAARRILGVILGVCAGVAHAHQRGVIHRDLKPSNVLVNAEGEPRVVDFGIARILGESAPATMTEFAGTPQYASPEQVEGSAIDVRTDVYSLGLLAYELLTGERAFAGKEGLSALVDAIRTGLDTRISRRIRGIPRDIDWVLAKAAAVDPSDRYTTVEAMARDVRAVLEGAPVEAHPPSVLYAIAKGARRHWAPVVVAGVIAVALLAVTIVSVRSSARIGSALAEARLALEREEAARERAEVEATNQEQISALFREIFRSGSTESPTGRPDMSLREAVDRAAAIVLVRSAVQRPEVDGMLRSTLGEMYRSMGMTEAARSHLEVAVDRYTEAYGPDHPRTLEPLLLLSQVTRHLGDTQAALRVQERVVAVRRGQSEGNSRLLLAQALNTLGITQRQLSMFEEAERSYIESIGIYASVLGPNDVNVALVKQSLAMVMANTGRTEEAERLAREAMAIHLALHPERRHRDVVNVKRMLAEILREAGRLDEAEEYAGRSLAVAEALGAGATFERAIAQLALGRVLTLQGRGVEATAHLLESVAFLEANQPPSSRFLIEASTWLERSRAAADQPTGEDLDMADRGGN